VCKYYTACTDIIQIADIYVVQGIPFTYLKLQCLCYIFVVVYFNPVVGPFCCCDVFQ